jgi:hypothetical protein
VTERFVDNWEFMPLEDVIESKEILDSRIGGDFPTPRTGVPGGSPSPPTAGAATSASISAPKTAGSRIR